MVLKSQTHTWAQKNTDSKTARKNSSVATPSYKTMDPVITRRPTGFNPDFLSRDNLLQLHRTIGNQALQRMLLADKVLPNQTNKSVQQDNDRPNQEVSIVNKAEGTTDAFINKDYSGMKLRPGGQYSSNSAIVQRKVGFEFQTIGHGANVFIFDKNEYVKNKEHDRNKNMIAKGEGFDVTADGSDLEFVTKAFDETQDERNNLSQTMDRMQAYTEALIESSNKTEKINTLDKKIIYASGPYELETYRHDNTQNTDNELSKLEGELKKTSPKNKTTIEKLKKEIRKLKLAKLLRQAGQISEIKTVNNYSKNKISKYKIYLPPNVTAHPQATVGVKLDKIFDLHQSLSSETRVNPTDKIGWGSYKKSNQRPAVEEAVKAVETAVNNIPNLKNPDTFKGFLTIIVSYIRGAKITADSQQNKIPNVKDVTPVMSRTSLAEIYRKLNDDDKEVFKNLLKDKSKRDTILGRDSDEKLFLNIQNSKDEGTDFTIITWLNEIAKNKDLLTTSGADSISEIDSNYKDYQKIAKKFKISRPTDIGLGNNIEGAIFELRAIKREVPYKEWKDTALAVFDLVQDLNGTNSGRR